MDPSESSAKPAPRTRSRGNGTLADRLETGRLQKVADQSVISSTTPSHVVAAAALTRASKILQARLADALSDLELSPQSFELLGLLYHEPSHRLTLRALRTATMYHPATLTRTVDQLEAQGLVRRKPDPNDRRGVMAEITQRASLLVEDAERRLDSETWGLAELAPEQAEAVAVLLSLIGGSSGQPHS